MTLTTEHLQVPETASPVSTPPRKSSVGVILGWGAVLVALAAAALLVLALVTSDGGSPTIDSGPPVAGHSPENSPRSANAAEYSINSAGHPAQAAQAAEAERYVAMLEDRAQSVSADGGASPRGLDEGTDVRGFRGCPC